MKLQQRDATQRESLTTTLRTLRADTLRHTTDMERLSTKHTEAQRKLGIAESTERAMKLQLKSAEQANRVLKEEMARMKVLVQQTRSQCAVEVRKRERTLEGLKKHVGDGRVRGGGKVVGSREITVVAGIGEVDERGGVMGSVGVGEDGYDLRSETNEFLTELARGLSEENEHLAALARRTVETLRTLSGWEKEHHESASEGQRDMIVQTESGYDNLAQETEAVLEHVRTLLTNPSFVPLEEVEIREEEIIRLREGWERMESRWRDAVSMMDGWRKRMARSGQTVNLEELKMGLMLSPLKNKDDGAANGNGDGFGLSMVAEEDAEGDTQADIDAMDDSEMPDPDLGDFDDEMEDSESSLFEEEPLEDEADVEEDQEQEDEEANYTIHTASSMSPGPPPQLSPLKESSGNARAAAPSPPYLPRKDRELDGFTTIVEENTYDLLQLASPKKQASARSTPQSLGRDRGAKKENTPTGRAAASSSSPDEVSLLRTSFPPPLLQQPQPHSRSGSSSPTKSSHSSKPSSARLNQAQATPRLKLSNTASGGTGAESRLPRPREQPPMQSPLTMASIAAKLAASEREADAARVRAKIKAARGKGGVATAAVTASSRGARNTAAAGAGGISERDLKRSEEERKLMPPPPTPKRSQPAQPPQSQDAQSHSRSHDAELARSRDRDTEMDAENVNSNINNDARSRKRKARELGTGTGRDKGQGRASRRRSTLSPWELESLILGGAGVGGASPEK
ncbi:hypothetical protein ONS95_005874 [Cadophora gregata]|uniref:uncharacterized protein n=1 Tax=Cadophora gregata TaxID=51156 RepID=UPI0026DD2A4F|nr:uncharacterized protein ONS95_005874 [Cadophora gregata]KAK0102252.1 hypothetical protein ONS95_005874 [Cadophora gregata]